MNPAGLAIVAAAAALAAVFTRLQRRQGKAEASSADSDIAPPAVKARTAVVSLAASGSDVGRTAVPGASRPLLRLYEQLCQAIAEERALGYEINSSQPPESFERLNAVLRSLLTAYIDAGHTDWQKYANFGDLHYVRNLVEENEDFEMMVICWKHGQGSRVHNHANSHGWVTVLAGQVVEDRYEPVELAESRHPSQAPPLPGVLGASSPCPSLLPTSSATGQHGDILYINDRDALHAVRCAAGCPGTGAVTLHVYAPPIRRVRLYEPDNDRVIERKPGFFTVRGRKA